ncbi:response regulator [Verrucomicrobium sp. BvORR106]|uniref:response regulator n=1 Tax=Verrucomicrobium sp. BvORR106 TaxID=1403819 RepID=UPI00056E4D42|nr:response regulator [Verrucomicrobium sp. BvORR106]
MLVLLVEDNPAEARLTQEALQETGFKYDLKIVSDGEMATQFLRRECGFSEMPTPNLILLDLNLPRKHGREVLQEIKSDPLLSFIPVIVVSNSHAPDDINEVYRLQGNCYLTKSADLDEFFSAIKALAEFWLSKAKLPSESGR